MNGAQRRLALLFGAGFFVILGVIMVANATSMASDFAAAHIPVTTAHVWLWEVSSIMAWLTLLPPIWLLVAWLGRARLAWWKTALIVLAASLPVSLWHVGLMVALRSLVYWLEGERYRFMMGIGNPLLYEYRKDLGTFLQFAAIALVAKWLIARAATTGTGDAPSPRVLAINEGSVTHYVPIDEIESASAAGNYVELGWTLRPLLHRATLTAIEAELGDGFVRIHRGHLVRRAAIRRVATDRNGDFTVELASGAVLRGSRRYRDAL
ncbi:LytR/AlgR family response regulator transcription factor [Hephaestia sp. GCM10023244]|uniref:LytR/AlgR family response regulator transcription factor n=1 Tax=unclassified Hephaestia TaxID=2631281 RepID=UPI0020777F9B|nr:LytTR family DNA-binding domain-containing protein [Hephaestia sp. MAHUQ-44]MCM8730478.1 LytTR family transcriptional regulator [Hephaestia sp. MAHUQ-44]